MNLSVDIADHPACILIVDDERHNRQLLEIMLEPDGFDLLTAASGEEALAMVALQPPDLILLDVMMPGMDGYQVASTIKGNPATKDIPVIMVTALDDHNSRMLGLNAGAEEFLTKPVNRAELRVRVRNLARLKIYGDDKHSEMLESEVDLRTADLVTRTKTLEQQAVVLAEQAALLDLAQDAIVVRNMHRQIVFWSRGAEVMYGWRSREALGQNTYALLQTEFSEPTEDIEATLLRQNHWEGEAIHHKRDGTRVSVASRWALQRDAVGVPVRILTITMDITERKQAEHALHQSEAQLRQAQKMEAVGRLAGGIAHDFNNLLSVVLGYSDMLIADLSPGNPMRADLEEIHMVGIRAAELTRQLLAFSRQQVLQPRLVNLNDVIIQIEKMLRRVIGEDIDLTTIGAPDLATVKVDPSQIEQVIMNLAVNARDAMPQGGKLTIETANIRLDEAYATDHVDVIPGPHVMLTVTDTGTGMDAVTQAWMFEPFFTTKEVGKGTGLGLATVFGIVRQSGGTIWVYSELGQGTTFKIYFPRADVEEEVLTVIPASGTLRGNETILLVEDDESVRNVSRTILRRYGYHVLEAESGDEALVICEQYTATIHLLLTDVVMPRMSGQQFAERLRSTRPHVKVLYMSGYTDNAISHHGVLDSDLSFIQKPLTPEALAKKVRQVIDMPQHRTA